MGLAEQIRAGATLNRSTITLTTDTNTNKSGSINLGAAYGILSIQTTEPCRFRLYDISQSLQNTGEVSRSFGSLNISSSVSLIGDFSMSVAHTAYTIDPIVYGVVENAAQQLSYYRIDGTTTSPQIQITRYLLEDVTVLPTEDTDYTISNRRSFAIQTSSLASNGIASGTLAGDSAIPNTYLLVSASVSGAFNIVRLRLYSYSSPLYDAAEKTRKFENEPTGSTPLIVDAIVSGSETTYFIPKIIGANLQNMGTDLTQLRINSENRYGTNQLYYIIENKRSVATPVTASIHLYALED